MSPRLYEDGVPLSDIEHFDRKRAGRMLIAGMESICPHAAGKKRRTKEYKCRKNGCYPLFHAHDSLLFERYERSARLIRNAIETRYMIQLTFLYCPAKSFMTV